MCLFGHFPEYLRPGCFQGHASKNSGGQARSSLRTVHLGRFWVDLSGSLLCGMPGSAFARDDPQSDSLQALLANPFFYVHTTSGALSMIPIPWMNRGALLWSLSTALVFSPMLHKRMTLKARTETSISGYILLDLWYLMAAKLEAARGAFVGSMTMARETVTNLQNLTLSLVCIATTKPVTFLKHAAFAPIRHRTFVLAIKSWVWTSVPSII